MSRARRGRGGKGGAEPRVRIRQREEQVVQLALHGRSQYQSAQEVGVSQPAVSKILRRVEQRLLEELKPQQERLRARHTQRLEYLYAESMGAWAASKHDTERRRQRRSDGHAAGSVTIAELMSENRHGDPRFLETARKVLADLSALWGVEAPQRHAILTRDVSALSDEELQQALAAHGQTFDLLRGAWASLPMAAMPPAAAEPLTPTRKEESEDPHG